MTILLDEIVQSLELWLKMIRKPEPYVDPNLDPVLLVPGIAGSVLNAVDEDTGKEERVWVRILGANYAFRTKLWSRFDPSTGVSYEDFLPQGFLERTRGVGMLCGWAPQVEVLGHKTVGGFVSHCGWNSILESLWYGVPIVTWPLYAEQQLNAFLIVRDLGLGVELRLDYVYGGDDFVSADEIERAVTRLMVGDSEIRKRVDEMSERCRRAVDDGGSSSSSLGSLIKVLSQSHEEVEDS